MDGVQITYRTQIGLGARQKSARAVNIDRQSALDSLNDDGLNGPLFVIGFLNLIPCPQPLGFLVREVDVAFLGRAFVAHDVNFVARLKPGVALMIQHFR